MGRPPIPIVTGQSAPLADRIASCKNPELAQWLKELWQEASQREGNKLQYVYKRAMDNMIIWPEPILDIKDAHKVPYLGPTIVARLEKRLQKFLQEGGRLIHDKTSNSQPISLDNVENFDPIEILPRLSLSQPSNLNNVEARTKPKAKKSRTSRQYVPTYRSGPYAVLIALYLDSLQERPREYCSRQYIVAMGQPYCQATMEEGIYSALKGALKTLDDKGLIARTGVPPLYFLTDEGFEMAEKLWNSGERRSSSPPVQANTSRRAETVNISSDSEDIVESNPVEITDSSLLTYTWEPGTYDIKLLLDNREVKSRNERDYLMDQLQSAGISVEQRALDLGDFIWIAKKKDEFKSCGHDDLEEVVLDLLIERKTEDDLVHSIVDGRFVEQKFRINSSGISNRIYLVEKFEGLDLAGVGEARFKAAIMHTQIIDNLFLRYTANLEESIKFIISTHNDLLARHVNKRIHLAFAPSAVNIQRGVFLAQLHKKSQKDGLKYLMTYACYSTINSKTGNMCLRDLFIRQLMTIKTMSPERALMIANQFETPIQLYRFYHSLPDDQARKEYFKDWCVEGQARKFGIALSQRVYEAFFCKTS